MATFLLTWNPDGIGWPDSDHEAAVDAAAAGRSELQRWSVALRKSGIAVGDRAFLVRQRRQRGIVASGHFSHAIYEAEHWDGPNRRTTYADIEFDQVLGLDDRLPVEVLKAQVPAISWDRLQGSGVVVAQPHDQELEEVWQAHVGDTPYANPEEFSEEAYTEGDVTRVFVNRYERDRNARAACIRHHGLSCLVCGFNYQEMYGPLGRDFIHVHHVQEISTLGPGYQVDPKRDLVPLCANCHAMVHRQRPALTPSQLKRRLRG